MSERRAAHNDASERIVLQAATNPTWWEDIHAIVTSSEMLYVARHRSVYAAIERLHAGGRGIDAVAVAAETKRAGVELSADLDGWLAMLLNDRTFGSEVFNYETHALEVREQWTKRTLGEIGLRAQSTAADPHTTAREALDTVQAAVNQLADGESAGRLWTPGEIADETLATYEKRAKARAEAGGVSGVPSGIDALDKITGGFQRPRYVIIGARTSIGKSALIKSIHKNLALAKIPSAIFTWEEDAVTMYTSIAAMIAGVNSQQAITGALDYDDAKRLRAAIDRLRGLPLTIVNAHRMHRHDLRAHARRLIRERGIVQLSADYLQKMKKPPRSKEDTIETIAANSDALFGLANETSMAVIAGAQLNRKADERPSLKPEQSDLRWCGDIEQDADTIVLIWRPEYYGKQFFEDDYNQPCTGRAKLLLTKNRNAEIQPEGIDVAFTKWRAEFHDIDPDPNPSPTLEERNVRVF